MLTSYIHDGMTKRGYIAEVKHRHPAVRFTYRPMLRQNRAVIMRQIAEQNDIRKAEEIAARSIVTQIQEWDITKGDGSPVPLDARDALRLEVMLFGRLFDIVTGSGVTDEDPDWTDDEKAARDDAELAAALGDEPEEKRLGNSPGE